MRSAILTFHSIDDSGSVISYPRAVFRNVIRRLAESRRVVPLDQIQQVAGSVALTFDDAFQNFHREALPLLSEYKLPATLFVVSDHCGARNDWSTQPSGIPSLPLMSWAEILEAADQGVQIGAHTATHPYLSRLSRSAVREELAGSRRKIEDRIGRPITQLAYPYGDLPKDLELVEMAGFSQAVSTELRYARRRGHPLLLPRLDTYYAQSSWSLGNPHAWRSRISFGLRRHLREFRHSVGSMEGINFLQLKSKLPRFL